MKTGMDREVVYVRDRKEIEIDAKYELGYSYTHASSNCEIRMHLLGYCGQIFKIVDVIYHTPTISRYTFYDFEEFKSFALENKICSQWDFGHSRWWSGKYTKFKEQKTDSLLELFHKHQTPLFLISTIKDSNKKQKLTINPSLMAFDFHRIKDTYTAYQDIFQYVAGTLNKKENEMVEISNADKIHKHGFDKFSFRKLPAKKKK